jgi:hypothetical protein
MTPKKTLVLRTETLRVLSHAKLSRVVGGAGGTGYTDACTDACGGGGGGSQVVESDDCPPTLITKSRGLQGCVVG